MYKFKHISKVPPLAGTVLFSSLVLLIADTGAAEEIIFDGADECSSEFREQLQKELELRTSRPIVENDVEQSPDLDEEQGWTISFKLREDSICEVSVAKATLEQSFELLSGADLLEISSLATRIAWIIEGTIVEEPIDDEPLETDLGPVLEEEALIEEAVLVEVDVEEIEETPSLLAAEVVPSIPPETERHREPRWSLDVTAGMMWFPSASQTLGFSRIALGWQPWRRWKLLLNARLPLESVDVESRGFLYSYQPWSLHLGAAFLQPLGQSWQLGLTSGLRASAVRLSVEESISGGSNSPPGTPAPFEPELPNQGLRFTGESETSLTNNLAHGAFVLSASISRNVFGSLAVYAETSAAISPGQRYVREGNRMIIELGFIDVDAVLGMELRF